MQLIQNKGTMKIKLLLFFLSVFCFIIISSSKAQIDVGQKVKDKVIERADRITDEVIDEGLDAVENGARNALKEEDKNDESEAEQAEESKNEADKVGEEGERPAQVKNKSGEKPSEDKQLEQQTLQGSSKYDFVPGDKILLFEDFSQDAVGDFPALWTTNGSGEVKTLNLYPGHWFHLLAADMAYQLQKPVDLSDNFIFEFDVVPIPVEDNVTGFSIHLFEAENNKLDEEGYYSGLAGVTITPTEESWTVEGYEESGTIVTSGSTSIAPIERNKLNHIIVWFQKRRVRIYHLGQKAVDLPTILYPGHKLNHLKFNLWGTKGLPYISNLRFTSAAPDMRSKLLTEGKIVSYGIYFDVNSDKVKPESYGSLNEIAQVLKENPEVKICIVGHTDSDGDDAKNLDLSKRRAASVKNELAKTFGIDISRIQTDGKGENQPVASNDAPVNKAKNRRVEFIKL
jgi:OmpA-OmpF porin, OOP family